MMDECYDCKWANEYLLAHWYPHFDPTCLKGESMNQKDKCKHFEQIGRLSR